MNQLEIYRPLDPVAETAGPTPVVAFAGRNWVQVQIDDDDELDFGNILVGMTQREFLLHHPGRGKWIHVQAAAAKNVQIAFIPKPPQPEPEA